MALDQLNTLLAGGIYTILLVFARVGSAMLMLPAFGDSYLPTRVRLLLAVGFALAITPAVESQIPKPTSDPAETATLIGIEVTIGLFIGLVARILMHALEIGGMIMAQQVGLSSATIFNPQLASATSVPGTFLSLGAVLLLFVTDLDHMLIRGLLQSYAAFPVGPHLPTGDLAQVITRTVSESFLIGVEIAAPFLVSGLLLFMGLGLMARLMPQLQIFFVAMPLQVMLGLAIFATVIPAILLFWLDRFQTDFSSLLTGE